MPRSAKCPLRDAAYTDGSLAQYTNCFGPTWGRHKARIRPAPSDHDYYTPGAAGYFDYFGAAAGPRGLGYYSYDLGTWHVVVLNSNCEDVHGGCRATSTQVQWLRNDLAASPHNCTVAYWHSPRFTSGTKHGNDPNYERFAPMTPTGQLDNSFGIRQIVSGTGGRGHYSLSNVQPNSQVRNSTAFGVTKLTLRAASYDWQFIPVPGQTFTDSGTTACHGPRLAPPPPPTSSAPVAAITARPDGGGYWTTRTDGDVEAFGAGTGHFGDASALPLSRPVVGIAATPTGNGYYLVDPTGKVFAFGDAVHPGDVSGITLKRPVVGVAAARNGMGYWLVASDGGISSFNAEFSGSTGSVKLNRPITGMAPTADGHGYWLVATDGGIFTFDAPFHGATGKNPPSAPVVGMATRPAGDGSWIATSAGQVLNFGAAPDLMP
ncbi:MAG: metallophosphoesterase family protein [Acidimicrobiia bacterium]